MEEFVISFTVVDRLFFVVELLIKFGCPLLRSMFDRLSWWCGWVQSSSWAYR